jgi:arsenate reductase
MSKTKVLFLCTGNSARSQIAEAFVRRYAGDRFEAYSAGLEPRPIHPFTLRVMEEIGYNLSGHRSKDVTEYLGKQHFGYLITVCSDAEARCPTAFPGVSQRLCWPIQDPAAFEGSEEETLEKFRQARNEIAARIKTWLLELGIPSQSD